MAEDIPWPNSRSWIDRGQKEVVMFPGSRYIRHVSNYYICRALCGSRFDASPCTYMYMYLYVHVHVHVHM